VSAPSDFAHTAESKALNGKRIIVTGASRGIGAAIAVACAEAGAASVALVARSADGLAATAQDVSDAGAEGTVCRCDVTDTFELTRAIENHGSVHVLVNCAGANQPEPFTQVREETFDRLWRLNVKATYFASQAVARRMIDDKCAGVIVNISSQMGHVGAPNRTVYCATKHAIEGLTKALAVELAPYGIRVVSIAPTFVRTAMTAGQLDDPSIRDNLLGQLPLRRFARSEDVATAVVFAASDQAAMITGSSLIVDGGWTAR
jgi:NAD(P)-dependent dehydrogenase (short-subunit alcohol dehydrogenase family)